MAIKFDSLALALKCARSKAAAQEGEGQNQKMNKVPLHSAANLHFMRRLLQRNCLEAHHMQLALAQHCLESGIQRVDGNREEEVKVQGEGEGVAEMEPGDGSQEVGVRPVAPIVMGAKRLMAWGVGP